MTLAEYSIDLLDHEGYTYYAAAKVTGLTKEFVQMLDENRAAIWGELTPLEAKGLKQAKEERDTYSPCEFNSFTEAEAAPPVCGKPSQFYTNGHWFCPLHEGNARRGAWGDEDLLPLNPTPYEGAIEDF